VYFGSSLIVFAVVAGLKSEIKQRSFTVAMAQKMLEQFIQTSSQTLLFLKSVVNLEIFVLHPGATEGEQNISSFDSIDQHCFID
jgi:hypothetical protein